MSGTLVQVAGDRRCSWKWLDQGVRDDGAGYQASRGEADRGIADRDGAGSRVEQGPRGRRASMPLLPVPGHEGAPVLRVPVFIMPVLNQPVLMSPGG